MDFPVVTGYFYVATRLAKARGKCVATEFANIGKVSVMTELANARRNYAMTEIICAAIELAAKESSITHYRVGRA